MSGGDDSALRALRVALGLAKPKARRRAAAARTRWGPGVLLADAAGCCAQLRVLLLGLERSGKSSWVQALQPPAARAAGPPPPTRDALVQRVFVHTPSGAFKLRCTDLPGGAEAAAALWPRHYAGAHALVFVLDAADALRVQAAQDALDTCAPPASRVRRARAPN